MNIQIEAVSEAVPGMLVQARVKGFPCGDNLIFITLHAADTIKAGDLLRQPIPGVAVRASLVPPE